MVADLAEQSGRARSGFNATIYNDVKEGFQPLSAQPPVLIGTAQFAWSVFRFGPGSCLAWPDEQFPMNKVDQLYHMFMQDKNNLQVADVIIRWIDEHVEDSSGLDH